MRDQPACVGVVTDFLGRGLFCLQQRRGGGCHVAKTCSGNGRTAFDTAGQSMTQRLPPGHDDAAVGVRPDPDTPPHWEVLIDPSRGLMAILTGSSQPLTVSADDLESLRNQIRAIILRAML